MTNTKSLIISLSLWLAMGLVTVHAVASVDDPIDPPQQGSGPGAGKGPKDGNGNSNKYVPSKRIQEIEDRFKTSLHATRIGKARFYNAEWDLDGNGVIENDEDNGGFEHLVREVYDHDVADYDNLPCKNCHYPPAVASEDTDTDDVLSPGGCTDCHWNFKAEDYGVPAYDVLYCDVNPDPEGVVIKACPEDYDPATRMSQDKVCIGCHSRQNTEHKLLTDVHRSIDAANPGEVAKFNCMGCHQEAEVHGDKLALDSHLDNPKTSCAQSGCHERELKIATGKKPRGGACSGDKGKVNERCVTFHSQHMEDVDCTSCHVQSNTTCNSCHFDSELEHRKRFYKQIPAHGFKFLMNFKDIQAPEVTKVRTANYQSLTVGAVCEDGFCKTEKAKTFVVFAPFASHSVTRGEELKCRDCHVVWDKDNKVYEGNPAVAQYLTKGTVTTTTWNPETKLLEGPSGIIPLPHDWITETGEKGVLDMDFVYWLGDTTDPVTKNPAGDQWTFLKTGPDRGHTPYGTPLSKKQMKNLILKGKKFPDE